jgi:hypothetical protein
MRKNAVGGCSYNSPPRHKFRPHTHHRHQWRPGMAGLTYDTAAEADADRAQQKELLTALGTWDRALRRDECGA